MTDNSDPQMALMFSFFENVVRKGPGSETSTLKALSMLDGLPPQPRIVDMLVAVPKVIEDEIEQAKWVFFLKGLWWSGLRLSEASTRVTLSLCCAG